MTICRRHPAFGWPRPHRTFVAQLRNRRGKLQPLRASQMRPPLSLQTYRMQ